jgi:hypothetical protein
MTGYAEVQPIYLAAGLTPIPLKAGTKAPPPDGSTGRDAPMPSDADYARWRASFPDGNTAHRVPDAGLGIDEDHYEGKTGAQTIAEGEKRFGPLPPTVYSTSRDDGSRIRYYRVPPGLRWRGGLSFRELGFGDVDLISHGYRYAAVWPSIHPEGRLYRWYDANDQLLDLPPRFEEWAELTEPWIEALRADARHNGAGAEAEPGRTTKAPKPKCERSVLNVTSAMTDGRPSAKIAQRLAEALADLAEGLSRHDTMCGHVMALLRFGRNGEPGVEVALVTLYQRFVNTVGPDREGGEAEAALEFERMISNAEGLLAAEPPQERFVWPGPSPTFDNHQRENAANDEQAEAEFWTQRDILAHVHRFARFRRAAPYAVLASVLRRAITLVAPHVQLPATVGAAASVNLFTVNVGRSGQGKDIANGVGRDAVVFKNADDETFDDPDSPGIGSGEGLARVFKGYGGEDQPPRCVHVEINEVGTLTALADRKGHTLVGELLKAFMGQAIGFSNAQKATTTFVHAHTYRLCLGVGAQPENTEFFLSREKDGLPQRFLWLPIVNPYALPPSDDEEESVPAVEVTLPTFSTLVEGAPYLIGVPASVRATIRNFHFLVEIGSPDVDPLDGHLMLVRLKVAFGLALVESRRDIEEDDWRIAGQLIELSNRVRADMRRVVADRHRRTNTARAHDQADREAIIAEKLSEKTQQRVEKAITRKLSRVGAATRRELQRACDSSISRDFPAVFDLYVDQRLLVVDGGEGDATRWRLALS